jgi:hypothetical protein
MAFELPPLNLTLNQKLGVIRAGLVIEFPHHFALALVRRRFATVVGDALVEPDLIVGEETLPLAEIEFDPAWLAAGATPALELQ